MKKLLTILCLFLYSYSFAQELETNSDAINAALNKRIKTNIYTNSSAFSATSNTTLSTITGLTKTLESGKKYSFEVELRTTSNVAGGIKVSVSGSATGTGLNYSVLIIDGGLVVLYDEKTTLGTGSGVTEVTASHITITGVITATNSGTLQISFAQNVSNGSASTVLAASKFIVNEYL